VSTRVRLAAGLGIVAAIVLAENLFGRQVNDLFLARPGIDKVLHVIEYFGIFAIAYWLAGRAIAERRSRLLLAGAAAVSLSLVDELVQQLAPGRSVELFDLVADWAGVTLAYVAIARPSVARSLAAATVALGAAGYVTYDTHARLIDYARALQHERQHEFGVARTYYERAIANGLRTAEVHNGLAWVTIESGQGDIASAVEHARIAYEMQPENADVLDTYGWALHHVGRHGEALALLQRAFEKKPEMFCIHYHLGAAYQGLGDRTRAAFHFRKQGELTRTREAALAVKALAAMGTHQ
jgi:Tfp pilus assembly protein PilF